MADKDPDNAFLKYSSLGLQFLGTIGVAGWIGYRLDEYFKMRFPIFLLGFVFVSFGGMMYKLYRSINNEK